MFFDNPELLWLLVIPALLAALYIYREIVGRRPHLRVSGIGPWLAGGPSVLGMMRHIPMILRTVALSMIIVAIARPRSSTQMDKIDTEGIDIVLAMDVSTSMLARDFTPDRISAAKDIAIEFISQRPTDRATLINLMKEIETGVIDDGTAIGNGLAVAVARIQGSDAKSRVVILLTDGVNNCGEITPQNAADIAKTYGVRVYTIGVGANGTAPYPVVTPWGVEMQNVEVEIDEDLLRSIAETTGGKYFRATDNTKLSEIYSEINKMEKARTTIDSFPVYKELFGRFGLVALICLLLEALLSLTLFRKLP